MITRPVVGSRRIEDRQGFTLIELLVVIVVIGILSTMAFSRFARRSDFDELGYAEEMAAAARYAQKLAVATRCPVRFELSSPGDYRLARPDGFSAGTCAANFNAEVTHPVNAQPPYAGSLPSGLTLSASGGLPARRDFNAQGGITPDTDLSIVIGEHTVLIRNGGQVVVQATP